MEKRTIGTFLAALRKAKGLTQKELAEMLGVSDKAVSRWERDECAPDIMLIPVLADIYGVTADEIIRGERKTSGTDEAVFEEKTRKRFDVILKQSFTRFRSRSFISAGLLFAGLVMAVICNIAFNRAYLAFGIFTVMLISAVVCEAVFMNNAISVMDTDELENELFTEQKQKIYDTVYKLGYIAVVVLCFNIPLLFAGNAYYGLNFTTEIIYGIISAAAGALLIKFILFLKISRDKNEAEDKRFKAKRFLKICICDVIVIALTFVSMIIINENSTYIFGTPFVFNTPEEFVEFMETPADEDGEMIHDDEEIIPEDEEKQTMCDRNGNIVCEFYDRRNDVSMIESSDNVFPIKVYTTDTVREANIVTDRINIVYIILYIAEAAAGFVVYFVKRKEK